MEGVAFLSGIGVGLGLLVIYRSLSVEISTAAGALAKRARWMRRARQSTLASVVSLVVVLATGWPMAGVLAWCFVVAAPGIFGGKKVAERTIARTESIASWIENLHDTLMGSSGLHRAIITTAQTAPEPIQIEVQELATSLERRDPFALALDRFAQSLDDPAADLVAMTLVMADDPNRHASDVGAVLQKLGTSLREEASMLRRVHASRSSARTGVNAIAVITIGMALGLAVFNNSFLQPYNSFTGQVMLLVVGGTFALSFWYLHRMVKPVRTQRFFVNISGSNGR
jgi:tight adherence protein B